jgi:hypothetical protein
MCPDLIRGLQITRLSPSEISYSSFRLSRIWVFQSLVAWLHDCSIGDKFTNLSWLVRSIHNPQWVSFSAEISIGKLNKMTMWSQVNDNFHMIIMYLCEDAQSFLCQKLKLLFFSSGSTLNIFHKSIAAQVNQMIQQWRKSAAGHFGSLRAFAHLITSHFLSSKSKWKLSIWLH